MSNRYPRLTIWIWQEQRTIYRKKAWGRSLDLPLYILSRWFFWMKLTFTILKGKVPNSSGPEYETTRQQLLIQQVNNVSRIKISVIWCVTIFLTSSTKAPYFEFNKYESTVRTVYEGETQKCTLFWVDPVNLMQFMFYLISWSTSAKGGRNCTFTVT